MKYRFYFNKNGKSLLATLYDNSQNVISFDGFDSKEEAIEAKMRPVILSIKSTREMLLLETLDIISLSW